MDDVTTVFIEIIDSGNCLEEDATPEVHILNAEFVEVLELIFSVSINGPISVLGSTANIINIIIFFKQGFGDSVNVSLCAIAVSDVGSLLPLLWTSICFNPYFREADIGFDSGDVSKITGGLPHTCFVRTTSWITAFITFERCVCIALPMKVKTIITPKRAFFSVVAIFTIIAAISMPLFTSIYFTAIFHNETNKTLVGLMYTDDYMTDAYFSFSVNVFAQLSSFIIVIIFTAILVLKLHSKSRWREKSISVINASDSISTREKRVVKMVTFISSIFIICYLPTAVNFIMMVHFSSEYSIVGRYQNVYYISWAVITTIDAINSSTTILIYYNMSSKYRASLSCLFKTAKATVADK